MFVIVVMVIFLTEITSNTSTTTVMLSIMGALAISMRIHPFALMITATTVLSYAFMLPVATPPNAVIFRSGFITIPQMMKAGIWLNLLDILLITYFLLPVVSFYRGG